VLLVGLSQHVKACGMLQAPAVLCPALFTAVAISACDRWCVMSAGVSWLVLCLTWRQEQRVPLTICGLGARRLAGCCGLLGKLACCMMTMKQR
jgi:hypothetical protein